MQFTNANCNTKNSKYMKRLQSDQKIYWFSSQAAASVPFVYPVW